MRCLYFMCLDWWDIDGRSTSPEGGEDIVESGSHQLEDTAIRCSFLLRFPFWWY